MRAVDLIRQKRDGGALSVEEIRAFVAGVTDDSWADYQIAALLMAIVLRGMTLDEAAAMTDAMVRSGRTLDLSDLEGVAVDKHSTGGVGDKTSLVLAPLAAACGVVVPMMSGRGLGHTGGTLDKLEAIPGFRTALSIDQVVRQLDRVGCVLVGQTDEIAPADRRLYALRDVTSTVESLPLICSSILSKKIAAGIGGLVLDVKVGRGAFLRTLPEARELAEWLIAIAGRHGVAAEALLTQMNAPLGLAVGNANEVVEAVETLKGRGPADVEALSVALAARMLVLSGIFASLDEATARVRRALDSGEGLEKFREIVAAQGGNPAALDDYALLPRAAGELVLEAADAGVVTGLDAWLIGRAAVLLGAGRDQADMAVHPGVGIDVLAPVGTPVRRGDPVLRLRYDDAARLARARHALAQAVAIAAQAPAPEPLILETITRHAVTG
jgi:pyrimidine-nucleoside phosphorylase